MNIACPHCRGLMVGDGIAPGSAIVCPHCQNQFTMTQSAAPAPAAPRQAPARDPGPAIGPAIGPGPAAPPTGPVGGAPAPAPTMPAPQVEAVWSDVGRRSRTDSSTIFLIGGVAALLLVVVLGIFFLVLNLSARETTPRQAGPNAGTVDLNAHVRCSESELNLTNKDPFTWESVAIEIKDSSGGSYKLRVGRMVAGRIKGFPLEKFVNASGNQLPSRGDIKTIIIQAKTGSGPGVCTIRTK